MNPTPEILAGQKWKSAHDWLLVVSIHPWSGMARVRTKWCTWYASPELMSVTKIRQYVTTRKMELVDNESSNRKEAR